MPEPRVRVVVVRGHQSTPWELRQWEALPDRFDVTYLRTRRNAFDEADVSLRPVAVRARRDRLPAGRLGDALTWLIGDRYDDLPRVLTGVDIVHAEELGYWFAADAARARLRAGATFKLVQTVWETIPLLEAWRTRPGRAHRADVLAATDLYLAATERARAALRLEGVPDGRIAVCPPGIDLARFASARAAEPPLEHVVVSPGRLVWEKGHQDVLRAVAALRKGVVALPDGGRAPHVLIVGAGPEERRLRAHAAELGIADLVDITTVAYRDMPAIFARASCMVLASLPATSAGLHALDVPRAFWEEQFGLVLPEAMAGGLTVLAAASGAIPEVVGGAATLFPAGDWLGLAAELARGPLSLAPGARVDHDPALLDRYSVHAAGARLAEVYDRVLAS